MKNFASQRFFQSKNKNKPGNLDDSLESYYPLLAIWMIELCLFLGWHKKARDRRNNFGVSGEDFVAAMNCFPTFNSAISARNERTSTFKLVQIIAHLTGQTELDIRGELCVNEFSLIFRHPPLFPIFRDV